MNRLVKSAILSVAVVATTLTALPAANAGDRWRHHDDRRHPIGRPSGDAGLLAAGILGLAAGAIIVGAMNEPEYREPVYRDPINPHRQPRPRPDRNYFPDAPDDDYIEPGVVYANRGYTRSVEPWTREWFRYCGQRYRTFDRDSGTFMGYDGREHFCIAD